MNLEDSSDEGKEEKIKEERDTPTETLEEETPENTEKPKEKTPEKTEDKEIKTTTDNKLSEKEDSLDENTSEESKEEPDKEILSGEEKTTEEFKCTDTIVKDEDKGILRKIKEGDFFVEIKEGILDAADNLVGWVNGVINGDNGYEDYDEDIWISDLDIEEIVVGIVPEVDKDGNEVVGSGKWEIELYPEAEGTTYYKVSEIKKYQKREIVEEVKDKNGNTIAYKEGDLLYLDDEGKETTVNTGKPAFSNEPLPGVTYDETIYYLKYEDGELTEVKVVIPGKEDPFKDLETYSAEDIKAITDNSNIPLEGDDFPMDYFVKYLKEDKNIEGIEGNKFNSIENIYDKNTLSFNNKFDLPTGEVEIGGNKKLTGKDLEEGEFEFVLKDRDGNIIGTVTNNKDGSFSFDIPVDHEGEFEFFLEEKNTGKANITYDGRIYKAVVRVCFDRLTNSLISEVVYIDEDGNELDLDKLPTFENEYEKPSEPTKPTKPTESSEPTKPTKPSEPTIPSEPTKPTKPTDSSVPTKETTVKKNGKDLPKTGMAGTIGISIIGLGLGLVLGGISQFKKKDD